MRLGSQVKPDGALFRIFGSYAPVTPAGTLEIESPGENLAGSNPTRVFPDMAQIADGNTNAATGTCPDMPPSTGDGARARDRVLRRVAADRGLRRVGAARRTPSPR